MNVEAGHCSPPCSNLYRKVDPRMRPGRVGKYRLDEKNISSRGSVLTPCRGEGRS